MTGDVDRSLTLARLFVIGPFFSDKSDVYRSSTIAGLFFNKHQLISAKFMLYKSNVLQPDSANQRSPIRKQIVK